VIQLFIWGGADIRPFRFVARWNDLDMRKFQNILTSDT
jgi:hypothetical protein